MVKLNLLPIWRLSILTTTILAICSGGFWSHHQAYGMEKLLSKSEADNLPPEQFSCPHDINELTSLMLDDLPAYSNRVIQRTQDLNQKAGIENYIITASKAEFEPLGLPRLQYSEIDDQDQQQVFFTVLERQYINSKIVDIQTYHWLFLTQTASGWRTIIMFSRFGNSAAKMPPAPPRETTNGIIGRGVQLWLRDCRAGTVKA
ncbi:MAG: hypothetical protein AAF298_27940 [Cyanobacteria bacterium P01_A01_bin.40]